jgi:hypothetical protein
MSRAKPTLARTVHELSSYKFDTSKYIVLDSRIRRDSSTGELTHRKTASGATKAKRTK